MDVKRMSLHKENRVKFTIMVEDSFSETGKKSMIVELTFIAPIPKKFICILCRHLLQRPCHVTCCNSPYCRDCIESLNVTSAKCAREKCGKNYAIITDGKVEELGRKIKQMRVHCPMRESGCKWIGSIEELETVHWNTSLIKVEHEAEETSVKCQYQEVECPNLCGLSLPRWIMREHRLSKCEKEMVACEFCGEEESALHIHTTHRRVCSSFPVECPNRCGMPGVVRQNIVYHLEEECLFRIVSCDYRHAGCNTELHFIEVPKHNSEFCREHLSLVSEKLQLVSKENRDLHQRNQKLGKHVDDLLKLIKNIDRTEYEGYVRMMTSKENKTLLPSLSVFSELSSSPLSSTGVKNSGSSVHSNTSERPPQGNEGKLVGTDHHYTVLLDTDRVRSSRNSMDYNVLVKRGRGDNRNVPPSPVVSDSAISSSGCVEPLAEKLLDAGVYEDIENYKPNENLEKRSLAKTNSSGSAGTSTDKSVGTQKESVSRMKSMGYENILPSVLPRRNFPASEKSEDIGYYSVTRSKCQNEDKHDQREIENLPNDGAHAAEIRDDANVYNIPVLSKFYRTINPETTSEVSGGSSVPLPQAYAKPVQTRFQQHLASQSQPGGNSRQQSVSNGNPDPNSVKEKVELMPKRAPRMPPPRIPVVSKRAVVSPNTAQVDSYSKRSSVTSAETYSVPLAVDQSRKMSCDSGDVKTSPKPSKRHSLSQNDDLKKLSPVMEKLHASADAKVPPKIRPKPPKITPKPSRIPSKTTEKSAPEVSAIPSLSNRTSRCVDEASKPVITRPQANSKSATDPTSAVAPGSRSAAVSGSKSRLTPRTSIILPGSMQEKVDKQKLKQKRSSVMDVSLFEKLNSELLNHF